MHALYLSALIALHGITIAAGNVSRDELAAACEHVLAVARQLMHAFATLPQAYVRACVCVCVCVASVLAVCLPLARRTH